MPHPPLLIACTTSLYHKVVLDTHDFQYGSCLSKLWPTNPVNRSKKVRSAPLSSSDTIRQSLRHCLLAPRFATIFVDTRRAIVLACRPVSVLLGTGQDPGPVWGYYVINNVTNITCTYKEQNLPLSVRAEIPRTGGDEKPDINFAWPY